MSLRRALLACGIASSLLYVGIDLLAAIRYPEYHSFTSRVISELMARGAPTKPLVDPLFLLYDLLAIAFGVGVWTSAAGNRPLRITAGLLIGYAVAGLPGPWLFPMNLRGTAEVGGDIPHIVLTAVLVLFIMAAVVVGAVGLGRRFRIYSAFTLVTIIAFGVLVSAQARGLAAGEPQPWIGVAERIDIGAFLLWIVVLARSLWRSPAMGANSGGGPALAHGGSAG
jgi:hypothetical protein